MSLQKKKNQGKKQNEVEEFIEMKPWPLSRFERDGRKSENLFAQLEPEGPLPEESLSNILAQLTSSTTLQPQKKLKLKSWDSLEPSAGPKIKIQQRRKEKALTTTSPFNKKSEFDSKNTKPIDASKIAELIELANQNQVEPSSFPGHENINNDDLFYQVNQLQKVRPLNEFSPPLDEEKPAFNDKNHHMNENELSDGEIDEEKPEFNDKNHHMNENELSVGEIDEEKLSKRSFSVFEKSPVSSNVRMRQEDEEYFRDLQRRMKRFDQRTVELTKKNSFMNKEFNAWLKAFRAKSGLG